MAAPLTWDGSGYAFVELPSGMHEDAAAGSTYTVFSDAQGNVFAYVTTADSNSDPVYTSGLAVETMDVVDPDGAVIDSSAAGFDFSAYSKVSGLVYVADGMGDPAFEQRCRQPGSADPG